MTKKEITLKSKVDKLPISVTIFIPDNEIKGILQLSHGMCEHKERYYPFMKYMSKRGYITVINDHRGHGLSVRNSEDLGYFYDSSSDAIVEDTYQITKYIKRMFPKTKLYLFGHSMGSLVVRKYIKKYDKDINKLIVCGSPSKNRLVNQGLFLVKLIKLFKGKRYKSKLVHYLIFGKYNVPFKEESYYSWITSNENSLNEYECDPYCGFMFTLNGFENLLKLMKSVYNRRGWKLNNTNLPILFIAGGDDVVVGGEDKLNKSINSLNSLGYVNTCKIVYDNMRHGILSEKNNKKVYKDILRFIEGR